MNQEQQNDDNKSQDEETKSSDIEKEQEEETIIASSPVKLQVFDSPDIIKEKSKVSVELLTSAWSQTPVFNYQDVRYMKIQ